MLAAIDNIHLARFVYRKCRQWLSDNILLWTQPADLLLVSMSVLFDISSYTKPFVHLFFTTALKSLSAASLVFRTAACWWLYHSLVTTFLGVAELQAHLLPLQRIILFIRSVKVAASFSLLCFKRCFVHYCCCHRALLITVNVPLFLVLVSVLWCSLSVQQVLS